MKQIYKEEVLDIPEGVTVTVKSRFITVTGPRGTLQKVRRFARSASRRPRSPS